MSSFKCLLLACVFLIGQCSANPFAINRRPTDRIVGGYETTIEDNPWQIALLYYNSLRCGGSIISENFVLTAAHCTNGLGPTNLAVRAGSSYQESGGSVIRVSQITQHRNYNARTQDYDFSLLRLAQQLTYSNSIKAVTLPTASTRVADGTNSLISGWGSTQNENESNDKIRAAIVPIVNQSKCNTQYRGGITARMICAGYDEGGKDSCQGDSGGPLTFENNDETVLIGVTSFGKGCGEPNFSGVYSRVSSVRLWIRSNSGV